jgi:hypothetical protein
VASIVDITVPRGTVTPDKQGRAEITFTVSNTSNKPLRSRAKVVGEGPGQFVISGEVERPFLVGGVQAYTVALTIPPGSPPGSYKFHLLVMDTANPGEEFTDGPPVGYDVPSPDKPPPRPIPWWIFLVAGFALLVIIGVLAYVFWPPKPEPEPPPAATALVEVPRVINLSRTDAEKLLREKGLNIGRVMPDIQGTVIDQNPHEGTQVVPATQVDLRVK